MTEDAPTEPQEAKPEHEKGVPCGICGKSGARMWLLNSKTVWKCDFCLEKEILEQRRKQ